MCYAFSAMTHRYTIVGIGEALFDIIQGDARLGGAPLNVAVHAQQLGRRADGRGVIVSRIGQDDLGERMTAQLREIGMATNFLQSDPDRPTGRVFVRVGRDGRVDYEIAADSAWDMLWFDPEDEDLATTCDAVCFGCLAQRDAQARNTIYRFLDTCRHGVKLFDANLRQKFYDQRVLSRSCEFADVVKLNREELPIVCGHLGIDVARGEDGEAEAIGKLIARNGLDMVVLTRGVQGTRLYLPDGRIDGAPASYTPAEGADAVGAGDACSAAILTGLCLRMDPQAIADLANHVGAYVAAQPGATPTLPDEILAMVE